MKILGFNFQKIEAERTQGVSQGMKISTNVDIIDINEVSSDMFDKREKILSVKFKNDILYEPDIAKIKLEGNILVSVDKNTSEKVLKDWKKKKLDDNFKLTIFNVILKKSSLRALQLEEELNLPSHIPMPSLKAQLKG